MATSATNRKNIKKNRRAIFEVEATVTSNRAKAYATRSIIEENRALILKNYTAAFMGNRQLANQNTDDVFRNRKAIIANIDAENDVQQNFKESLTNEASLEFLEHRASLNTAVLSVNEKMIAVNQMLIDINDTIMSTNASLVKYNAKQITANNKLIADGLKPSNATPSRNAERIKRNAKRSKDVQKQALANSKKMDSMSAQMQANRKRIEKNSDKIMERRSIIIKNAGDDCLDFETGNYIFNSLELDGCIDKAFQIKRKSNVKVKKLKISNSKYGGSVLDSSLLKVDLSNIETIKECLIVYRENDGYYGSLAKVTNNFKCNKSKFFQDNSSQIINK